MKNLLLIFSLVVILPFSSNCQDNSGFEEWDSVSTPPYAPDEVIGIYNIPDAANGSPEMWTYEAGFGVLRTTDAYSGLYALVVHTWYGHVPETISYEQAIQDAPEYISGYYKYNVNVIEDVLPKGQGTVIITNNHQDTISLTNFEFDTTSVYKYFEFELNQTNESPASIQIVFQNADNGFHCSEPTRNVCNFLYLDDIKLERQTTGTIHPTKDAFKLYPNPSSSHINIDIDIAEFNTNIYNAQGKLLTTIINEKSINIEEFPSGLYFIAIQDDNYNAIGLSRFVKK